MFRKFLKAVPEWHPAIGQTFLVLILRPALPLEVSLVIYVHLFFIPKATKSIC